MAVEVKNISLADITEKENEKRFTITRSAKRRITNVRGMAFMKKYS